MSCFLLHFPYLSNHAIIRLWLLLFERSLHQGFSPNKRCHCFPVQTWQSRLSNQSNIGLWIWTVWDTAISIEYFSSVSAVMIFGISVNSSYSLFPRDLKKICAQSVRSTIGAEHRNGLRRQSPLDLSLKQFLSFYLRYNHWCVTVSHLVVLQRTGLLLCLLSLILSLSLCEMNYRFSELDFQKIVPCFSLDKSYLVRFSIVWYFAHLISHACMRWCMSFHFPSS